MRALLCAALLGSFHWAHAAPLRDVDQNPFLAGLPLPEAPTARLARGTEMGASLQWSNTALVQTADNEALLADYESQQWQLEWLHGFDGRWAIAVQLPYWSIDGGSLDSFIENWHSAFGMQNGNRDALPEDALHVAYRRNDQTQFQLDGESGWGDLRLLSGYQLSATPTRAISVWAALELPTASDATFIGNDAVDASLTLAAEQQLSSRWTASAIAGVSYFGSNQRWSFEQQQWLGALTLGGEYRYSNALSLGLQVDAHTAAYRNTELEFLNEACLLSLNATYRFADWQAQLGVIEDVMVDSAPDVTFVFYLRRAWR